MDIQNLLTSLNFSNFFWQIATPLIFSILDIISGFIVALIKNNLDSKVMREGIWHKLLLVIIIIVSCLLDITFSLNFCSRVVSIYLIIMELISIIENLSKAGINLGKLTSIIRKENEKK